MELYTHHRGIHLRRGDKSVGGDSKELFGRAVIAEHRSYRAAVLVAGGGAETVGYLGLYHYRDVFKGKPRLKKLHKDRRGDVIGEISADRDLAALKIGRENALKVCLHNVLVDNGDVPAIAKRVFKHGDKTVVYLKSDYVLVARRELLRKRAYAGAYLKDRA